MKKTRMLLSVFLAGVISLSGCEEAPNETVDNNETLELSGSQETGENQGIDVAGAEKYVSLAEAKEQVNQLKGNTINGFTFSKKFEMPEIDSISSLKLKQHVANDIVMVEETLSHIWDYYDSADWSKIEAREFTRLDDETYLGISKEDTATGYWFSSDTDGFFAGNSLGSSQLGVSDCVKYYDFLIGSNFEDVKNDKYMLKDGEITVGDAVAYVEGKFNEHLVSLENGLFEYKVQKLYALFDASTQTYELAMTVGRVYNGIAMATVSDFGMMRGDICYEYIHCGDHINLRMRNTYKIDNINFSNESIAVETVDTKDSIISPFWAVRQMDEQVANIGGVSYGYCGLVYIITKKNYEYENNKQADYSKADNEITYLKPYWMFSNRSNSSGSYKDILSESVLVDAIDGTLYYYDGTGAYAP